jgi:hypothetical protein
VRTGFGSGNSDVIPFGGAAAIGGTSGVLRVAASAVGSVEPAGAWPDRPRPEAGCWRRLRVQVDGLFLGIDDFDRGRLAVVLEQTPRQRRGRRDRLVARRRMTFNGP